MFLLYGLRGGRRGRTYVIVRLALLVGFLVAVFAFHAHGRTLAVLEAVRVGLLVALIGSAWLVRRRRAVSPSIETD